MRSDPVFVEEGVFDPSLFFDGDGSVSCTRRGGFGLTDSVQAELDIAIGTLNHPLRSVRRGFRSGDCEGPHLYKIHGWYFMMQAEGDSRYLLETIGRSKSLWGGVLLDPRGRRTRLLSQHGAIREFFVARSPVTRLKPW